MGNWLAGRAFPGKAGLKAAIGPFVLGVVDYLTDPTLRQSFGGPFNGQTSRRRMVEEIVRAVRPAFVVETGTFRGTTTEYFAQLTTVPIHTVECERRFCGYSWARLLRYRHVHVHHGESSAVVAALLNDGSLRGSPGLFYLDAHWGENLPLADEIDAIFKSLPSALVLIDDFQVPDDPGYRFDDYGPGKALTLAYLVRLRCTHRFDIWFPACKSGDETGSRRGCVLLTRGAEQGALGKLASIRRWTELVA